MYLKNKMSKYIFILADNAGFNNLIIRTDEETLINFHNYLDEKDDDELFNRFYNLADNFQSVNVEQLLQNKDDWLHFNMQIIEFYIIQKILYNINIPFDDSLSDNMISDINDRLLCFDDKDEVSINDISVQMK